MNPVKDILTKSPVSMMSDAERRLALPKLSAVIFKVASFFPSFGPQDESTPRSIEDVNPPVMPEVSPPKLTPTPPKTEESNGEATGSKNFIFE